MSSARRTLEDFAYQLGGLADDLRTHVATLRPQLSDDACEQLRALARALDDATAEVDDLASDDETFSSPESAA